MYELEREIEVLGGVFFFLGGFTFAFGRQLAWEHIFLIQFRIEFIGGWSSVFSSLLLPLSSLNVPHERLECLPGPLLLQEPGTTIFVLSSRITSQEVLLNISASQLCYLSVRKETINVGFTSLLFPSLHVLDPYVLTALIVLKQIFFF